MVFHVIQLLQKGRKELIAPSPCRYWEMLMLGLPMTAVPYIPARDGFLSTLSTHQVEVHGLRHSSLPTKMASAHVKYSHFGGLGLLV